MAQTNLDQILKTTENPLYSKAIENYLCHYTEDADLKRYMEILVKASNRILDDVMESLNKAIKQCRSTGILYLLLAMQLGSTRFKPEQRTLNRKLYLKLIKEFGKIPESCRKKVGRELKLNKAYNYRGDLKVFRTWSQSHREDEADITFGTLLNAISLSDEDIARASESFYESFQRALKQSNSFRVLGGLNNAVMYMLKIDLNRAVTFSSELSYYAGLFGEVHHVIMIIAGTLMKVAKENRDYDSFFEAARIMDYYYEKLAKPVPSLKKMYQNDIRQARKYALVRKKKMLKRDEISNTKTLREFLRIKIGRINQFIKRHDLSHTTVYRVLNGESPIIRIKTLRKLIEALEIEASFDNPKEINYVLRIMKAEKTFEKNIIKITNLSDGKLTELLIKGMFISLPDETLDYCKMLLLVKERKKFLKYIKGNISGVLFINRCFEPGDGFYRGRQILFDTLCEEIPKGELLKLYKSLKTNEEIECISRYFREYSRLLPVNFDSNVRAVMANRFSDPDYRRIMSFFRRFDLGELKGYLCTWFFEEEKRERLLNIFSLKYD